MRHLYFILCFVLFPYGSFAYLFCQKSIQSFTDFEFKDSSHCYVTVDSKAKFKGDIKEFIRQNIRYPNGECITGKVIVRFTIQIDGSVSNIKVVKGISPEANLEAIRIVKLSSGMWQASSYKGQKMPSDYILPITFNLNQ